MQLMIKELENIISILLQYVKACKCTMISFSNNNGYYQKIWHKDRNLNAPPTIAIHDFDDDLEQFKNILSERYIPIQYDLERLGALSIALGAILARDGIIADARDERRGQQQLTITELQKIFSVLLQFIKQYYENPIMIANEDTWYQKIRHQDRNLYIDDPKITIGDAEEDMAHLRELLNGRAPNPYDLERLGAVLMAVSATW